VRLGWVGGVVLLMGGSFAADRPPGMDPRRCLGLSLAVGRLLRERVWVE
jgi:hypothetical protein